jgi:hypothetical protein
MTDYRALFYIMVALNLVAVAILFAQRRLIDDLKEAIKR